ncbi:hypothetical protein K431DRAFT_249490 [Polychaeton citri CBS 116435]|uniref:histidine kinase n=1 Tax=Polychaeton citri CBS 116435 TaxID=1314669 RepID=A0A9P4UPA3_9PEZI|nr:hypothetical protein K431DRAFT_249490 [Polychaeton citri CBS 116435]
MRVHYAPCTERWSPCHQRLPLRRPSPSISLPKYASVFVAGAFPRCKCGVEMDHQSSGAGNSPTSSDYPRYHCRRKALTRSHCPFRQRTEASRARDALRYLHYWTSAHKPDTFNRNAFPDGTDLPLPEPEGSPDATLTAFAQLAALRLCARRCLISLVSTNIEYVLAEATKTMSLQYDSVDDPADHPWIGTCCFPRADGVSGIGIDHFRKAKQLRVVPEQPDHYYSDGLSQHFYLVSDCRADPKLTELPFVKHGISPRFIVVVPLRDALGSAVGSVTIIDDKPRYGLSVAEMGFLEDLADTLTEHLEATILRVQRQMSGRMIQGLGLFNDGSSSLRDWWIGEEGIRTRKVGRYHNESSESPEYGERIANKEFGVQEVPKGNEGSRSPQSELDTTALESEFGHETQVRDFTQEEPSAYYNQEAEASRKKQITNGSTESGQSRVRPLSELTAEFDVAHARKLAFGRATNLIREALNVEGSISVNANIPVNLQSKSESSDMTAESDSASSAEGHEEQATTESDADGSSASLALAKIDGFSTRTRSTLSGFRKPYESFSLTSRFVSHLVKRYPTGKVFNYSGDGTPYTSGSDENTSTDDAAAPTKASLPDGPRSQGDATRLRKVFSDATSILFFPLRDESRERWRSCTFVWTTDPFRCFTPDEATYLASFGHSITAELSRIDAMASYTAQATFVSSVSHELRSPLHGVLAGVEFLLESQLSSFQTDMAYSISMAGRTLLDTVDHILDHSKVSNISKPRRHRGTSEPSGEEGSLTTDATFVDLAKFTEEIVESTTAAFRFKGMFESLDETNQHFRTLQDSEAAKRKDDVSIVFGVSVLPNWTTKISRGSWTRIITNVLGNALKYTEHGRVAVRLESSEPTGREDPREVRQVRLIIEDSGIGMSPRFLKESVYTPFKQENPNSIGTGLGLSIVRRIAKAMDARLQIDSKIGKGTTVSLSFSSKFLTGPEINVMGQPNLFQQARSLPFSHIHLLARANSLPNPTVASSVFQSGKAWLGCTTSIGPTVLSHSGGTVVVIQEDDLASWAQSNPEMLSDALSELDSEDDCMLVLARSILSVSPTVSLQEFPIRHIFVQQPVGPQRLYRALASAGESSASDEAETFTIRRRDRQRGQTHVLRRQSGPDEPKAITADLPESGTHTNKPSRPRLDFRTSSSAIHRSSSNTSSNTATTSSTSTVSPQPTSQHTPLDTALTPGSHKALLVEDNEINMRLLSACMRKLHIRHETASNGLEAIQKYEVSPASYFLILMDLSMPVMDGTTATARIRDFEKRLPRPRHCRIIALTGVTNSQARSDAYAAGVDGFHTKPMKMAALQEMVGKIRTANETFKDEGEDEGRTRTKSSDGEAQKEHDDGGAKGQR